MDPYENSSMKRWDLPSMLDIGRRLFSKIHQQKHHAHHNHEVHFLARELDEWLVQGVQDLLEGNYTSRFLKRHYFPDEMIDQLHLSDRVLQNILLQQLKPTFTFVMNPHCYHLAGPSGVKHATQQVRAALEEKQHQYIIRADIKSYYKSIPHRQLIQDICAHYHDAKLTTMLERIITNPIETPRGYKNPDTGIALRGPLSQFFSALYLKPLDDAFNTKDVAYFRYQDDILILCQTHRSFNRCKQRLMTILDERQLRLSGKKTRMGFIHQGFHFLGIHYPQTRPMDNITTQAAVSGAHKKQREQNIPIMGGVEPVRQPEEQLHFPTDIVPHARTLRKAREQVQVMVKDGFSARRILLYLHRWCMGWARTITSWLYHDVLLWFLEVCWDEHTSYYALRLLHQHTKRALAIKYQDLEEAALQQLAGILAGPLAR